MNEIREIEHVEVPMSDGVRLSARIWLPEDAARNPVPAVLEYIPYRKRDFTAARDALQHPYFASHGYASVRLDTRGAGDSEGVMLDEYTQAELEDGRDAIAWLAAQPWCSGRLGMIGGSWGGFNALQVAALRPPALKAIVTAVSTDDRYADDMHYMGGALMNDMMSWGQQFFTQLGRPPDPAIVGEAWRVMWAQRLSAMEPVIGKWLRHQRRDDFWKHGSICEDYGAITCAVYAVGGWVDGYSNAIFRMLAGLSAPRKALVGPWGHGRPHFALPGPQIGYLHECLRWWDHWLKDRDTGIMREPMLRVWMQDSVPPSTRLAVRSGRWVAEPSWPSPHIQTRRHWLDPGALVTEPGPATPLAIRSPHDVGIAAGEWCPYGLGGVGDDLPMDQRLDDAGSLVFDGAPLAEALEILGAVVCTIELESDRACGQLVVRLSDLRPDGAVTRVSYGVLNLTHRDSHEHPMSLEPGRRYRITLRLNEIAHVFPRRHRLRVAISTCYWPIVWPAPEAATLTIQAGLSSIDLPVRAKRADDADLPKFLPVETASRLGTTEIRSPRIERHVTTDLASGEITYAILRDDGATRLDATDTILESRKDLRYRTHRDDPLATRAEGEVVYALSRGAWRPRIRSRGVLTADRDAFTLQTDLDVHDGERRVFARSWTERIARDQV